MYRSARSGAAARFKPGRGRSIPDRDALCDRTRRRDHRQDRCRRPDEPRAGICADPSDRHRAGRLRQRRPVLLPDQCGFDAARPAVRQSGAFVSRKTIERVLDHHGPDQWFLCDPCARRRVARR